MTVFQGQVSEEIARLKWQCRRGMLELDLMLEAFINKKYANLEAPYKSAFRSLLKYQDQKLLDCLMGHIIPEDKDVAYVAEQVRIAAGPDN